LHRAGAAARLGRHPADRPRSRHHRARALKTSALAWHTARLSHGATTAPAQTGAEELRITMLRARLSLPLSLLVLGGCFGAHSTGEDAGPSPIPDGGELWVDCFDALRSGSEGQPCAFTDSCGEPRCGESGRELLCLSGQLHFVERICTLGPWESCEDYLAHDGVPGSPCVPGTFGSCSSPVEAPAEEPCCTRQARCDPDSWLTVEEVDCIGCG